MKEKVQRVAVIGAGVSGALSASHLSQAGLDVTVYERSSTAGGVWVYDERRPPEPVYPSTKPSLADFVVDSDEDEPDHEEEKDLNLEPDLRAAAQLRHAPPGPCYASLKNNVPTPLLKVKDHPWPDGTPDFVDHRTVAEYVKGIASRSERSVHFRYDTRVERIWKDGGRWKIRSKMLKPLPNGHLQQRRSTQEFDAVVVASGHYHASKVPDIPGLKGLKDTWPDRVHHSKAYRTAAGYKNQNVLLIGAGTSSTDIARDLGSVAGRVYQSSRGGNFDLPVSFLPPSASRIGAIDTLENLGTQASSEDNVATLESDQAIPGTVRLKDGTILSDIHSVIVCTGYHCSYPFLANLHRDHLRPSEADDKILVSDGTQMHNLHKDIFYIPDPTLSFVGVPYYTATFTMFEFQAIAMAAVYSGRADLPSPQQMRQEYQARLRKKGPGKNFHNWRGEETAYVKDLVDWVNRDGRLRGLEPIEGHTPKWHVAKEAAMERLRARFHITTLFKQEEIDNRAKGAGGDHKAAKPRKESTGEEDNGKDGIITTNAEAERIGDGRNIPAVIEAIG